MSKIIHTLKELHKRNALTEQEIQDLTPVVENFSLSITDHMYQQMNSHDANDPIAMQFIPSIKELNILPYETSDPIGDNTHMKVKGVIHRYPDRCLLTPIHVCAVYCRFCLRREKVGVGSKLMSHDELAKAYAYISAHQEIWEVILSGGDPLFLKPAMLNEIINHLVAIEHVGVIRIHTRIPVVDPLRMNADLLKALTKDKPIYVVVHANHPNEFTPQAKQACHDLSHCGIPLLSQTVLLKGVNDNIETLSRLMKCFVKNKIKPYYLHQCDLAQGTQHFRTTIRHGQSLMKQLRGKFSGLCQPTYMLDIPGGHGKSPIGPHYLYEINDVSFIRSGTRDFIHEKYIVEDFKGKRHLYEEGVK